MLTCWCKGVSKLSWTYAPPISRSGFANAQFSGLLHGRSLQWESLSQMAYLQDAWQLAISKKILSRQLASVYLHTWIEVEHNFANPLSRLLLPSTGLIPGSWELRVVDCGCQRFLNIEWVEFFHLPHDYKFLWTRKVMTTLSQSSPIGCLKRRTS